ncbi:MAG: proline--tRNA ligase [Alphaproteobacteria bacterium]
MMNTATPKAAATKTASTPTRAENYPEWYLQVVKEGQLAENSSVRGCMIIKPWGYALWENMQRVLDGMFKATGHKNAYFPIFIPVSLMSKEAEHVDGFATECAVVTHHRLEKGPDGKLHPAGELEEPYIVRPTSEMIINEAFAKWVQSYRDLPLLINQWCNVVRWEMRTRLFLRTAEFLWQEGHTVHATAEEAKAEAHKMHDIYAHFMEDWLAMPVIKGRKSESERFPGADDTLTCEAMMQDGKALQAGTSHFLGQNFAKAAGIQFLDKDGTQKTAWTTSWGVSTRMIGGMIMCHSDDDGLILPPKLAPAHVVILPFLKGNEGDAAIITYCENLKKALEHKTYFGQPVRVELDDRDIGSGAKKWEWVKKGIPLRVEVGAREVAEATVSLSARDKPANEKQTMPESQLVDDVVMLLDGIQSALFARAQTFAEQHTRTDIADKAAFYSHFKGEDVKGFVLAPWDGDPVLEKQLKTDLAVTVRCLPLKGQEEAAGKMCVLSGKPAKYMAVFAKAY